MGRGGVPDGEERGTQWGGRVIERQNAYRYTCTYVHEEPP